VKWIGTIVGAVLVLLGGLWLLQGSGVITIAPIACIGACEPLEGPSLPWAVTGVIALAGGAALVWFSLVHRRH
jgi:hypothetical protein